MQSLQNEFNGDLVAKDKASEQAYINSLRSFIERVVTDVEQIVANIKIKAQKEAEEEAVRIIDQAKQGAAEISKKAEAAARKKAEDVLSALNKNGEISKAEARQMVQLYLLRAREEIEKEVREEYRQAHSRLLHSLLGTTAEVPPSIEIPSLETTFPPTPSLPQTKIELEITSKEKEAELNFKEEAKRLAKEAKEAREKEKQEAKLAAKEEANRLAEKDQKAKEALKQAKKQAKLAAKGKVEIKTEKSKETAEMQMVAEEEAIPANEEETFVKSEEPNETIEAQVMAEEEAIPGNEEETLIKSEEPNETIEAQEQVEREITEELLLQPSPEAIPDEKEAVPVTLELDRKAPYEGEVEIAVSVPVDPAAVSTLYNHLQMTPEIKILYTRGSWDKGTAITVTIDKPLRLIDVISRIPGINITPVRPTKSSITGKGTASGLLGSKGKGTASGLLGSKGKQTTRVDLMLQSK